MRSCAGLRIARSSNWIEALKSRIAVAAATLLAVVSVASAAKAQSTIRLSLDDARNAARTTSPDLRAATSAVEAARGRELQAGAIPNPVLAYSTERTSGAGQQNQQHIVAIEQRVELGGQRNARTDAATFRRRAAEARLEAARASLDFEVAKAYAIAVGADRKVALSRQAAAAFSEAARVSQRRLASGDISVYADRRLRLEAARYAAMEVESVLAQRAGRVALASLISTSPDSMGVFTATLIDSLPVAVPSLGLSGLQALATRNRSDFKVASLEADALAAEGRLVARERIPTPVLSGGYKTERSGDIPVTLSGFAAGISLPLGLWDRRRGAIQAAGAEVRRAEAEKEAVRRRVLREVVEAYDALIAVEQQRTLLAPQLGAQSAAAVRSAQTAYAEGEISLLEWLDAVRAYHEAESAYSNLLSEFFVRRATLERAIASPLTSPVVLEGHPPLRAIPTLQSDKQS